MRALTITIVILGVIAGATVAAIQYNARGDSAGAAYRTVPVRRDSVLATISATGTIEPEEVVDVGAQVAGRVSAFGTDEEGKTVDYGSVVEQGALLGDRLFDTGEGRQLLLHGLDRELGRLG